MAVHKSGEDYLEAILMIQKEKGSCRSIDIVRLLGVSKPSVSVAMGLLRNEGMITTNEDGYMSFTDKGYAVATDIYARHVLLTDFLVSIGVNEETAMKDACEIEHDISRETFDRLKEHIQKIKA